MQVYKVPMALIYKFNFMLIAILFLSIYPFNLFYNMSFVFYNKQIISRLKESFKLKWILIFVYIEILNNFQQIFLFIDRYIFTSMFLFHLYPSSWHPWTSSISQQNAVLTQLGCNLVFMNFLYVVHPFTSLITDLFRSFCKSSLLSFTTLLFSLV